MCMGYGQEIKAWVCEQNRRQVDDMLQAWGQAWLLDAEEAQEGISYLPHVPQVRSSEMPDGGRSALAA